MTQALATKIPLKVGQRFRVNWERDRWYLKHEFVVKGITLGEETGQVLFSTFLHERKTGKRLEHAIVGWPEHALIAHAKRGELEIEK